MAAADGPPEVVAKRLDVDVTEAGAIVPRLQAVDQRVQPELDAYRSTLSETRRKGGV